MRYLVRIALLVVVAGLSAQRQPVDSAIAPFVTTNAPLLALTHARVIDGTGAGAREDQTLIVDEGIITAIGAADTVPVPPGAVVLDLSGRTVMPGLVMVHEHLYYPTGPGVYGQLGESFVRLYLAGGVTTMRTGGNVNGFMDLNLKRLTAAGTKAGPEIDATAPYLNGPNNFVQMRSMEGPADARKQVTYWADEGATSFKAYMNITRGELGAAIDEAHKRGIKVTGHLCSVTYGEAADLGIDNLEHGFFAATDFVADKAPDTCPSGAASRQALAALTPESPAFVALAKKLIAKNVALTSTLTVFETFTPGRPMPPGLDVLVAPLKEQFERAYARTAANTTSPYIELFPKMMALELAFAKMGGTIIAGTDPTGGGGVIPGFSNQRALELLVDAGFTPLEAISIGTRNGARYLGRDARTGTLEKGKQADLIVINGNPAANIADIRNVETVFKRGIGFSSAKLIESVKGKVGLW